MDTENSLVRAPEVPSSNRQRVNQTPMDAGWRVVAVSAVGLAVSAGTLVVYCFAVFLKPLSQEFHWSRGDVSWALTAMNLVVTIGSPMVGKLTDRFGARAVALPSIALLSGVLFSFYFLSPNFWLLYALYSLCGLFGVGATPVTYSRVVTTWFDERRGLALGITTSGMGVGAFVMPLFAQWIITGMGWRWGYVALGVAGLAIPLPLATLFLREAPGRGTQRTDFDDSARLPHTPGSPRPAAIRTAVFWRMTISFFLLAVCLNGTVTHLSALLTDAGSSPRSAAFSIALFGGATFAGRIITGLLVDYVFAPYVAGVLFGGAALAVSLLAIEPTGNSGNAVAVLLGLGVGAEADVMPYLISRYFGIRALGELFGYVFGAYTLGVAVGPVVMGAGFDATGSYHLPLTAFALALLVAIIGTVTLPKYSTS